MKNLVITTTHVSYRRIPLWEAISAFENEGTPTARIAQLLKEQPGSSIARTRSNGSISVYTIEEVDE